MSTVTVGDGQLRSEKHSKALRHIDQYWSTVIMCDETHQTFCRPEFINVLIRGVVVDTCRPKELMQVTLLQGETLRGGLAPGQSAKVRSYQPHTSSD